MDIDLCVEINGEFASVPTEAQFKNWIEAALQEAKFQQACAELSIQVVSKNESQSLNREYRGKDKPTNVLSFPVELPDFVESPLLGDLVICAPVVEQEAKEQGKCGINHWAHLTIHGVLHLLGFDHIDELEAEEMESLEARVLARFSIANPYQ